jgi:predicted peptidase
MPTSFKQFFVFLFLVFSITAIAQPSRFSTRLYTTSTGDTLRYRQANPDNASGKKYPLIIFLHGSGERGNDNEAQLKWGVMNFVSDQMMLNHPAFIIAPQCPSNNGWSNFTRPKNTADSRMNAEPLKPMALVLALIQDLIKKQQIDTSRIYITGLSMGGFGVYDAIMRNPHLFAAAVPVCGGGDISLAPTIAHLPIWIFHGANDPTVSPAYSVDMLNALTKAGAHPGITFYPGVGHLSWLGAYADPAMIEWLFSQHK